MNRTEFIKSHGASCKNWRWSWSFVNHEERFVIFGLWDEPDYMMSDGGHLMLSESWKSASNARGNVAGYNEAIENIGLIKNEKYELKTFVMIAKEKKHDNERSVIKSFRDKLLRNL